MTGSYVPFVILCDPRTGSNWLTQALNSSRHIICFREVFNFTHNFVQFNADGYDDFSNSDLALRTKDPVRFLDERVYGHHPQEVQAVGCKLIQGQQWGFQGLIQRLSEDSQIRVLRLERHNLLRSLVSLKIARHTGVWMMDRKPLFSRSNALMAFRDPLKAVSRLRIRFTPPSRRSETGRRRKTVNVSPRELYEYIIKSREKASRFDKLFRQHPKFAVSYEEMIEKPEEILGQVQTFLGVERMKLTTTIRQQNPEPLAELIGNYGELAEAYKDTQHVWMLS